MKKILLTGATGFVGRQVMHTLLNESVELTTVVRKGKEGQIPNNSSISRIITTEDLFSESVEWWSETCANIDTVIHVAWYTEPGKYLQSPKNLDCLTGTINFARGAVKSGVKRFVGVGTCFEYDLTLGVLSKDSPLKPTTPYASSKVATFVTLSEWLPLESVEFAWCRLFYLYGEGEDDRRLVPYLHKQLKDGKVAELTSGKQVRDFMDVKMAAKKIVEVSLSDKSGAVNICSGEPITLRGLAEKIADEYGRKDLLKFGARPDNLVDPICIICKEPEV